MADPPSGRVAFLFTDLEGSTAYWERRPESMPAVYQRHDAILRAAILAQSGRVYKIMNRRPPDCELAKIIMPEFIDPSRDCWAYSKWVGIARTW